MIAVRKARPADAIAIGAVPAVPVAPAHAVARAPAIPKNPWKP